MALLNDCARAWEARYRHGLDGPRTPPLLLGSAFDATAEAFLRRRWRREWPTVEWLALRFHEEWEAQLARPEVVDWGDRDPRTILADGVNLATAPASLAYLRGFDLAPHPDDKDEPALQVKTELAVPGVSVPVLGWIDAIARGPNASDLVVVDFKTARRRWPKGKERKELQARVYLAALWQAGHSFASLSFEYAVFVPGMTPEGCAVHRLSPLLSERDLLLTLEMLRRSWRQVKAGAFPPNPNSFRCGPGCPEFSRCFGG